MSSFRAGNGNYYGDYSFHTDDGMPSIEGVKDMIRKELDFPKHWNVSIMAMSEFKCKDDYEIWIDKKV